MRSRRATAPQPPSPPVPDDGYRTLDVAEVLADLPSLNREQLLLVRSLEESGDRRGVILDRIADLLVVQEAAEHLRAVATTAASAAKAPAAAATPMAPTSPAPPAAPVREVSPDLLNQMGGLLAKSAARTAPGPPVEGPPSGSAPLAPPAPLAPLAPLALAPATRTSRRANRKAAKADKTTGKTAKAAKAARGASGPKEGPAQRRMSPVAHNGHIVPGDGRRSRSGHGLRRVVKVVVGLVVVAALIAGGALFWKQTHKTESVSSAAVILKVIPGRGYATRPELGAQTGPSNLAQAARDDGAPDGAAALAGAGFVNGFRQVWTTANNADRVSLVVYRFGTPAGATAYRRRAVAAAAKVTPTPPPFSVPEITGAAGLGGTTKAEVIFARGTYLAEVVASNTNAGSAVREATLVAVVQYTALPPSQ